MDRRCRCLTARPVTDADGRRRGRRRAPAWTPAGRRLVVSAARVLRPRWTCRVPALRISPLPFMAVRRGSLLPDGRAGCWRRRSPCGGRLRSVGAATDGLLQMSSSGGYRRSCALPVTSIVTLNFLSSFYIKVINPKILQQCFTFPQGKSTSLLTYWPTHDIC